MLNNVVFIGGGTGITTAALHSFQEPVLERYGSTRFDAFEAALTENTGAIAGIKSSTLIGDGAETSFCRRHDGNTVVSESLEIASPEKTLQFTRAKAMGRTRII